MKVAFENVTAVDHVRGFDRSKKN